MSRQLFEEARKVLTQEAAVKLDPVGQEDKDIDNDRDVDKTDKYLHKRRKAISAAIASSKNESSLSDEDIAKLKDILGEQSVAEEVEQIDEISLDLAKQARDKAEYYVDMDYDDMRDQPYGYSEKQRSKFQRYIDKKEPRAKGDRDWDPPVKKEEVEQIDEVGDTPAGKQMLGRYIQKAARRVGVHSAIAKDYSNTADDKTASPAQRMAATTLAAKQKHKRDMRLRGVERATKRLTQEEVEDFELIENLNITVPDNPSYQDYIKAALTIAECNSFSELSEEDQQYIISEMENAFRNNDIDFIVEAEALSDMNDTVQRLRKAGHKVEDMGKDYKGQPFYVYVDKGTGLRRKVTYKGNQKVTQNMGKAAAEDSNEA